MLKDPTDLRLMGPFGQVNCRLLADDVRLGGFGLLEGDDVVARDVRSELLARVQVDTDGVARKLLGGGLGDRWHLGDVRHVDRVPLGGRGIGHGGVCREGTGEADCETADEDQELTHPSLLSVWAASRHRNTCDLPVRVMPRYAHTTIPSVFCQVLNCNSLFLLFNKKVN